MSLKTKKPCLTQDYRRPRRAIMARYATLQEGTGRRPRKGMERHAKLDRPRREPERSTTGGSDTPRRRSQIREQFPETFPSHRTFLADISQLG